jgi:hypothetical protein
MSAESNRRGSSENRCCPRRIPFVLCFNDFANLPNNVNESTKSSAMWCHGYQWELELHPGGISDFDEDEEIFLSLSMECVSAKRDDCEVKARFALHVPSANSSQDLHEHCNTGWAYSHFHPLTKVLFDTSKPFLVDGNLTIEVDIQVYKDASPSWEPKNELQLDMMKILESTDQSGDVTFQVGPEEFSAHRHILEARAPVLAALAEDCPSGTPIPIQDIKPSAFRSLLRFVYANDVEDLPNEARELLDVANRFGCKALKLAAEAELASSCITVDTAADMILIGDAKNCALLKEAAIDCSAANSMLVKSSKGWKEIEESLPLMKELMDVVIGNKKRPAPANGSEQEERDYYKRICVSTLRRKLEDKGLDVDGSREMLISRLEQREDVAVPTIHSNNRITRLSAMALIRDSSDRRVLTYFKLVVPVLLERPGLSVCTTTVGAPVCVLAPSTTADSTTHDDHQHHHDRPIKVQRRTTDHPHSTPLHPNKIPLQ